MRQPALDKIILAVRRMMTLLMPRLRYATKEQFLVILLNSKNKVIGTELVSEGSLTNSVVHRVIIFCRRFCSMQPLSAWHIIIHLVIRCQALRTGR